MLTAVSPALATHIAAFYAAAPDRVSGKKERKRIGRARKQLVLLRADKRKIVADFFAVPLG